VLPSDHLESNGPLELGDGRQPAVEDSLTLSRSRAFGCSPPISVSLGAQEAGYSPRNRLMASSVTGVKR